MPHTFTDSNGQAVQVLTTTDLSEATNRLLRWILSVGIGVVITATVAYVRLDGQVQSNSQVVARREADQAEMAKITRKVDSLTYVLGTQTEILRDIQRRVSR